MKLIMQMCKKLLLILLSLLLMTGCTPTEKVKIPEEAKFLTENQWEYYNANTGESEKLTFGEDIHFSIIVNVESQLVTLMFTICGDMMQRRKQSI